MKKTIAIILSCIGVVLVAYAVMHYYLPIYGVNVEPVERAERLIHSKAQIQVGNAPFEALLSDTEALRSNGLSGFKGLSPDQAMLFVFPTAGDWGFWMKDMFFPIDIIWVDALSRIVFIQQNATPESYPQIYYPNAAAKYVIEVNAGTVSKKGIQVGDVVSIDRQ
jgi:uncharacterized protein